MKLFRICVFLSVLVCSAAISFGQYGLYGSPDTLNVSQPITNAVPSGSSAIPAGNSTTSASGTAAPTGGNTASTSYTTQQPVQSSGTQQSQPYPAQTTPYTAQQAQSYPAQSVPYMAQQVQRYPSQTTPYTAQQTQLYAAPTTPYTAQQTQPAKLAATYGQTIPQYTTPVYSRPMSYASAAGQSGVNQPAQGQTALPSRKPCPGCKWPQPARIRPCPSQ